MREDLERLRGVERGEQSAACRFFRFNQPTLSYGRLQKRALIEPRLPPGWNVVQRPTGGGIVFHNADLCLSLVWRRRQAPLPNSPKEVYRWIHQVIKEGLGNHLTMAGCAEICHVNPPSPVRDCFKEPVGYDLLSGNDKVVGGALYCTRQAMLYQGSLQCPVTPALEESLKNAFRTRLSMGS